MSTTPATPSKPSTPISTIPAPRLVHEGKFCSVLNSVSLGKTRTTQKPCLRATFRIPCADSLTYRGSACVVVKTFTMPDPGSEGFDGAYNDLQRTIEALNIPEEAFNALVDSTNLPLDDQRRAWFAAMSACVGHRCIVDCQSYSSTKDTPTGPETISGISVDRVLPLAGPFTLATFDVADQTTLEGTVQSVDESNRSPIHHNS